MKISVVIPVYNAMPYLRACLDSVLAAAKTLSEKCKVKSEECAGVEVICVDDGSTDGSGKFLDEHLHSSTSTLNFDFKVIHQPNAGVSAARNAGMAAATGDLVAFLDADDTYDPRALDVLCDIFGKTGADVIRYECNLVRSHAKDVPLNVNPIFVDVDIDAETESPLKRCALGAATAVSRRLAKSVVWPSLSQCEDPIFVLRCLKASKKSVFVSGSLVNYLIRNDSSSHLVSLKIVTATCRYLVMAYDECASMTGFPKFRLDTCNFLAGFLNGPLANCGNDVDAADRAAAEAAVADVREKLCERDEIFRMLTRHVHYDLVFSLGSACSSTETLRAAGLQFASFPFDWLLGPGPLNRVKTLTDEFSGWMNDASDFEEIPNPGAFQHASWRNRRTGYSHLHDFNQGESLVIQLPAVREKFHRRAERLLDLIRKAKRVLVVWTGDPCDKERISDEDLASCLAELRNKFPGVEFDLQVFECVATVPASNPELSVGENVVRVAFDYHNSEAANAWTIRRELLLPYLSHYSVTDYRTPELRRAHALAERQRDRMRFPAKTTLGYLIEKLEFKLYKHLKKVLTRRGVRLG